MNMGRYMARVPGIVRAVLLVATLAAMSACSHADPDTDAGLVARVGKQRLMRDELDRAITPGLSAEDSTAFARAYVKSWVDARVMSEVASRNIPDMTTIDRMVDDYRNELIAWEYSRLMFDRHSESDFPADTIEAYYQREKKRFVLDRPLVKGVYIKIADNSPVLARVRKLYKSTRDADIDRLEKQDLQGVIHYDYFRDRWVDWEQIETRMPGDFGDSPDAFVASHKHYEVTSNGFTHLLEITDYLPTGSPMPIERARTFIVRDLYNLNRQAYDTRLRMELLSRGLEDGTVVINTPLN